MSEEPSFWEAWSTLDALFSDRALVALLVGAERSGLLGRLRDGAAIDELTATTELDPDIATAICRALVANEVAVLDGGRYRLTSTWRAMTAPDAFTTLDLLLGGLEVQSRLLGDVATGSDYWTMPAEDRLVFARSISPNPYAQELVAAFRHRIETAPDQQVLLGGGRLLELGCGVAGRLLTTLQAVPVLSAVGVELTEDLAAEARRRATELGIADRLRIVCADATSYADPEPFDFGFWSQFFFPARARAGALATLMSSVRPGGTVWSPVSIEWDEIQADPTGTQARAYSLFRVVLASWGVPERPPQALAEEFEHAGFVDVRLTGGGTDGPIGIWARRP